MVCVGLPNSFRIPAADQKPAHWRFVLPRLVQGSSVVEGARRSRNRWLSGTLGRAARLSGPRATNRRPEGTVVFRSDEFRHSLQ